MICRIHLVWFLPLQEVFAECYKNARAQAADETGLRLETFPLDCPYTPGQALDYNFLPQY